MKKKTPLVLAAIAAALVLGATAAAAGTWWWMNHQSGPHAAHAGASAASQPEKEKADPRPSKYVSLEKVVVMLRAKPEDPPSHYLALDIVFKTPEGNEKLVKEHLPLLRSLAVRALSTYTMDHAARMNIDDYAVALNKTFRESYRAEGREQPFSEAMIGKLIIE
ncbi:MAG: flagellar basal body protein [Aquabacterium sp.]